MQFTRRTFLAVFLISFFAWSLAGCGSGSDKSSSSSEEKGAVFGRAQALQSGSPVKATVAIGGETVETNEQGWFFIVPPKVGDRRKVTFRSEGHLGTQRIASVRKGKRTFVDVRMFEQAPAQDLEVGSGGELTFDAASVDFPAGAIEGTSGTVQVSLTNVDPSLEGASLATPGDYTALPGESDEPKRLETYGMVELTVQGGSESALSIAGDKPATVEVPLAQSLNGTTTPPDELSLWRYDESNGRWVEDGTATYSEASSCYVGDVSGETSTYWTVGQQYEAACLTGKVVKPDTEKGTGGIQVRAEGLGYVGTTTTRTDSDGSFRIEVMRSTSEREVGVEIQAQSGGFYLENPKTVEPTPTSKAGSGNCKDIGEITLDYPVARFVMGWGEKPSDLDSHFTGPVAGEPMTDTRFHVSYKAQEHEQAFLDTDDTDSFGPEVVSLLDREPGTYVYSIKNYAGESSGTLRESGATVQTFLPGDFKKFEVTSAKGEVDSEYPIWRVFRFKIDESGEFGSFKKINKIVDSSNQEDISNPAYHPDYTPESSEMDTNGADAGGY